MGVFVGGGLVWLGVMAGWCELRLDVVVAGSCCGIWASRLRCWGTV